MRLMKVRVAREPRLLFMLMTTFVMSIGGGIVVPVYPRLVESLIGGSAADAAAYYPMLLTTYAAAQFLFAPLIGQLSDRFGRRPLLLLAVAGAGIASLIAATTHSLAMLFVARVIAGICGGGIVSIGAYVVDVSPPEKRAQNFGAMWGTAAVGRMIGPFIGGTLAIAGSRAPFWASASLDAYIFLYGLFLLPESLAHGARQKLTRQVLNPLAFIGQLRGSPLPPTLLAAFALSIVAVTAASPVSILFMQWGLGWDVRRIGFYLTLSALATVLGQVAVTRVLIPTLGERRALYTGQLLRAIGWLLTAFIAVSWQMYALLAVAVFGSIVQPLLGAAVSRAVPPERQGQLQGALTSVGVVAETIGPMSGGLVFTYFTAGHAPFYWPGGAFVWCAILGLATFVCTRVALTTTESGAPRDPVIAPPQAGARQAGESRV
jgi:DHA1 family tetracycline resistance protein-like MFS transporter